MRAPLPAPRGAVSKRLLESLLGAEDVARDVVDDESGPERDPEDDALALFVLHELHYRGFEGVDERWEWSPRLAPLRHRLETDLENDLRARWLASGATVPEAGAAGGHDVPTLLAELVAAEDGPSLARHVQRHATREQAESLLRQRSLYHLKEADPTTWVIPRLESGPKAAMLEVQFDEYGNGDPARMHHRLFEDGLRASGIDAGYGRHVDEASTEVLEQNNALTMFGLHRRLRGAAIGHFAAFEATSSVPSRQLSQGLARLGFPPEMCAYYDEHVEADAVHEQVVLRDICAAVVAAEPEQLDEVLFGAWVCLDLETRTARATLAAWGAA
ncbi:iron-containing redox enzyme family protein [Nocardioides marinquilinus]|uniref:Iron-containing redox enzyme family protein n=1 Tax=Nocardioides marinquilinus TaxID=1210400 RepID=A0ABP9PBR9_9ACTN